MTRRKLIGSLVLVAGSPLLPSVLFPTEAISAPQISIPEEVNNGCTPFWACWIGHSTVLMRIGPTWILTDPVLFNAYGLNVFGTIVGPHRIGTPAMTIDNCPKPDLILLSHAHIDHMDVKTLQAFSEKYPSQIDVITAANTMDVVDNLEWKSLAELDWYERTSIHGCDIEAIKVKHNGWRWPGDACRAAGQVQTGRSYNGYHISSGGVGIVFGGDTAYTNEFARFKNKTDVAIMPIGAYGGCMDVHCTPEEAVAMTKLMNARHIIPIHHATFKQSSEPVKEPLVRLEKAIVKERGPMLAARHVGDTIGLT